MGVVMALMMQFVKLSIIAFVVTIQGSKGSVISPSPAFSPVIHPREETPGPIHHGQTWGSSAPSSPSDPDGFLISPSRTTLPVDASPNESPGLLPRRDSWRSIAPSNREVSNGSFLHPPVTLPPPASAPTPQKIKGIEPSIISPSPSSSTITLSPPSTAQGNAPSPSVLPGPPQMEAPAVSPPPSAPVPSTAQGNAPPPFILPGPPQREAPPVRPPPATPVPSTAHGDAPPPFILPGPPQREAPAVSPPPSALVPSTAQGNAPPPFILPGPPQREAPPVRPPPATPVPSTAQGNAPPPFILPGPRQREAPPVRPPPTAPVPSTAQGNAPPPFILPGPPQREAPPVRPTPATPVPSTAQGNAPSPFILPGPPQREAPAVSPPPSALVPSTAQGNAPPPFILPGPPQREAPPVRPPPATPVPSTAHGDAPPPFILPGPPQREAPPVRPPPTAPVPSTAHGNAPPPFILPGSPQREAPPFRPPPTAPVPSTTQVNTPPPFILPGPPQREAPAVRPPMSAPTTPAPAAIPSEDSPNHSPVSQPIEHGSMPPTVDKRNASKSHTPGPVSLVPVVSPALTPSRSFHWKEGRAPVSAPMYKTPKPLPAVLHSPAEAPAAPNSRQFDHPLEPLIPPPKSPFNKDDHSPVYSPSTTFYKHHRTRNTVISPAPESSYFVSPPSLEHQDHPIPPSVMPISGRRHQAPPPMNTGSSVSPFAFPIVSPASQASNAPSPSFKISPHPTKIFHRPKISPSPSASESPKMPVLPHVHALPPPPPNEDCLSTTCSEPYANSPPGAPCRCVLPMKVGLRLNVSLYTFFPLVSELASEISTGVFMKKSQVRIMGANAASQDQDKTEALIDLVPLGEEFDKTTAFLTSDRFWHKQVVIQDSYFGDYEVLYVIYPGLPPSPPLPPSSISIIDGGPYSNNGNNGRMIKPIGVDIPKSQHNGGLSKGIIVIIALSVFLAVVLCSAAAWALFYHRHHVGQPTSTPRVSPRSVTKTQGTTESLAAGRLASASSSFRSSIAAYSGSAKTFSVNEIEKATDNFHASRILGEGGFGRVFSGILEDGTKVAVKVLKREDHHGDREFLSEVEMLSRLHHRNLVKLIGICTEVSFRCLVYELIPNGSVESHLHGVDREKSPLDWSARIKIALGAARGLAYLHEDSSPHVIHRDFKSSNILLEEDFTPKVSDFGLARTAADENRHISTRVMGTFGYVAPEYAMTGHLLVKSDVYSYGVVLLELLTGRKPVDMLQPPGQENLVAWARPLLTSKEGLEAIIDSSLGTDVPLDSIAKVAAIASMCVQPEVSDRPFMGEVVQALKLVSNECDEAKEAGTRNSSQEDLSVDLDTVSGQLGDSFQGQFSGSNYVHGVDIENGLSASEIFGSSARFRRQASGSFRRHSYSGPLRTERSRRLWQIIRSLSGGSVSEHGTMFKL